jgi:hypothetical protein
MLAILDRTTEGVNAKKALIRKALHGGWSFRLAGEVVFMPPRSRLRKTTGELEVEADHDQF